MTTELKADYDEISPITGNKCVILEVDELSNTTSYICMESGYVSNSMFGIDTPPQLQYHETVSQLMRDLSKVDSERSLVWYPAFMQTPAGMLYVAGTSSTDVHWEVAPVIAITEEEQPNYPVPGKDGKFFQSRAATELADKYDSQDFELAMGKLFDLTNALYEDKLRDNSL
jgi:hypothetical protein